MGMKEELEMLDDLMNLREVKLYKSNEVVNRRIVKIKRRLSVS